MNLQQKPKEIPVTPLPPDIKPDVEIPLPNTEPEHPIRIIPIEEPDKKLPPEVIPEKEKNK
ncbi:MAG: hypothetical protein IPN13_16790 [Bacteroidetes bacterium]|nr:hypothetical protein [Bacteroidota bacterium]MBK7970667.1 hypothetical protein [Bacteroidota bacterium]MBK8875475.1 hypothetical protein [Bacteroidota bacterium]MBK9423030.1 hypothetical protein [Bacteroidota bacterium]MBL0072284.1 hypothetical protein [Bacteroidota bacterium]